MDLGPEVLADLARQAASPTLGGTSATLSAEGLAGWPADARAGFWQLWRAVSGGRSVTLAVDGREYRRPVDLAVGAVADLGTDPDDRNRAFGFVADLLSRCYPPAEQPAHLEAVLDRLKTGGLRGKAHEAARVQLRSLLTEAAREPAAPADDDLPPYVLARRFLRDGYAANPPGGEGADADPDAGPDPGRPLRELLYYDGRFYRRRPTAWVPLPDGDVRLQVTRFLQRVAPDRAVIRQINDVLANVQALCRLAVDRTPPPPFYAPAGGEGPAGDRHFLALENGLLDLDSLARGKKPKLKPHDPGWFSTGVLPYAYDPKAGCPQFLKFLRETLDADPETGEPAAPGDRRVDVLQEWFGYNLLTDARFQTFLVATGKGRNGKGVTFRLLAAMLGPENVAAVGMESLGQRFGLAPLVGKAANVCGDLNEVDNVAEGVLKQLTGEDAVTVDRKHREAVDWTPAVKLTFLCNDLPRFKDRSSGVWRRMLLIPFLRQVPADQADGTLTARLRAELPGILNWAVAGLRRLLKQRRFTACEVCAAAAARHRVYCDPVAQFVEERVVLEAGAGVKGLFRVAKNDLYQAYQRWCIEAGCHAIYRSTFGARIADLPGVGESRGAADHPGGKRPEFWTGLALDPPACVDPGPPAGGETGKAAANACSPAVTTGKNGPSKAKAKPAANS